MKIKMKKLIAVITASVCAIAIGVTAVATNMFGLYKRANEQGGVIGDGAVIGESDGIYAVKIPEADYARYGLSGTETDTAYTLTATIVPGTATNKEVDWSISFVNANSAWAKGKTLSEYVTVTPESDGALKAVVACKKAFGERIKVTVSSRADATKKAECTVDYAKRVRGLQIGLNFKNGDNESVGGGIFENLEESFTLSSDKVIDGSLAMANSLTALYSDYTVDQTYTLAANLTVNTDNFEAMKTATGLNSLVATGGVTYDATELNGSVSKKVLRTFMLGGQYGDELPAETLNKIFTWANANQDKPLFYMIYTLTSEKYLYSHEMYITVNFGIYVTGVTLDKTQIIF